MGGGSVSEGSCNRPHLSAHLVLVGQLVLPPPVVTLLGGRELASAPRAADLAPDHPLIRCDLLHVPLAVCHVMQTFREWVSLQSQERLWVGVRLDCFHTLVWPPNAANTCRRTVRHLCPTDSTVPDQATSCESSSACRSAMSLMQYRSPSLRTWPLLTHALSVPALMVGQSVWISAMVA